MATNENQIGVEAVFDLAQFNQNLVKYTAALNQANANTQKFYNEQAAAQTKSANASKQAADKHSQSLSQMKEAAEKARTTMLFVFGGIIAGYKFLEAESKRLGDTETIGAFDSLSQSVTNLGDSFAAMVLNAAPVVQAIQFITDGIVALTQVITLATAQLTYFLTFFGELNKITGVEKKFATGELGEEITAISKRAKEAAEGIVVTSVQAPQAAARTKSLAEQEKENVKARAQTASDIRDYYAKLQDLQIKSGESLLEAEKEYQSKSAAAWSAYIEKANQIIADGIKKRAEIQQTYTDTIGAAETEYQRGAEDAATGHAQKLQDIERDYQNNVRNIQQTYSEDALDAVRNLDAIGLLRAREKRDKDLANARQSRDQANQAENTNYERQLFELQRALEDKKREAELAYQRGLEDQRRAEQESLQAAKTAYGQQNAETRAAYDEKLASIQTAYRNEDAAAQAHYFNQQNALQAHLIAMQNLMAQYGISTQTGYGGSEQARAKGGLDLVSGPTRFLAGEAGPEMVYTAPLNRDIAAPMTQTVNHIGDFSHSINAAVSSSVAGIDGRIQAVIEHGNK